MNLHFPHRIKRLFSITLLLSLAACSSLPSKKLQADAQMVVGDKNAQHELAIYFSPGCPHCLKLFKEVFETVENNYIDTGELRVAFYEVPSVIAHSQGSHEEALADSHALASDMRCNGIYNGADAYVDRLQHLVDAIDTTLGDRAYKKWPPIKQSRQQIFTLLHQKNPLSQEQIASCQAAPLSEAISAAVKSHSNHLFHELGAHGLPSYYLNGKSVPINTGNSSEVLFDTLQQVIDN